MTLKIIGAGYGRTGTTSLKLALEMLGFGPCYHMSEVLTNTGHVDRWLDVAAGRPDWTAVFSEYQSTVDFPAALYWRELAAVYPDAKILLSVRDAERWFQSTQKTIFSEALQEMYHDTKWGRMIGETVNSQISGGINNRDACIQAFENHNNEVKASFGPDRLLVYEVREGWAPLCAFLGVAPPEATFPNVNSVAEFVSEMEFLKSPAGAQAMDGRGAGDVSVHDELSD